jgi:hypothetical protein
LLPRIVRYFYLTVRLSQSNDPKIKIQKLKSHGLPTPFHLFSYIKGEMRDIERKKSQIEEIKIEIQPSQLQMAIIFYWNFQLRRATRLQKAFSRYGHFRGQKTLSSPSKTHLKFFFVLFCFFFVFLEIV